MYGHAKWASWWYAEEQWSLMAKAVLFAVIITIVVVWVKISRQGRTKSDVGYEKTLA